MLELSSWREGARMEMPPSAWYAAISPEARGCRERTMPGTWKRRKTACQSARSRSYTWEIDAHTLMVTF